MELVDVRDSKSLVREDVPVRLRPPLPYLDRSLGSVFCCLEQLISQKIGRTLSPVSQYCLGEVLVLLFASVILLSFFSSLYCVIWHLMVVVLFLKERFE